MKNTTLFLILIPLLILFGCTKHSPETVVKYEMEVEALSWDEIVENSNCIVEATYEEYIPHDEYVEYKFRIEHVKYGSIENSEIYLYSLPAYGNVEGTDISFSMGQDNTYIKGETYLLLLEKRQSLFYDHDRYLLPAEIILPCRNLSSSTIYGIPLQEYAKNTWGISNLSLFLDSNLLIENINEQKQNSTVTPIIETGEDLFYTLQVHVDEFLMKAATHSGLIYSCSISNIISGNSSTILTDEPIYLVTLPDMVETGSDYIVNVQRSGSDSFVFSVTSEYAVSAVE